MLRFTSDDTGSTLAAASGTRALVVRVADDPDLVEALWQSLSGGESLQAVLDVVTRNGISKAPAFALVDILADEAGTFTLNCIVRGDLIAEMSTATGARTIDASRATTWVEDSIADAQSFSVSVGGGGSAALPLVEGAVWASSIAWSAAGAAVSAPRVTPAVAAPSRVAAAPAAPAPAEPAPAEPAPAEPAPAEPDHAVAEHTIAAHTVSSESLVPVAAASAYDKLFEEETVVRSIEDAAVRPPSDDEHETPTDDSPAGDHDGMTVMTSDLQKLRGGRTSKKKDTAPPPPAAPRYILTLSSGASEVLEGTALVGRSPSVSRVSGGTVPKLIAIPGNQDISRNHVQFSVEGDTVVVTDLNSRNGTTIVLPGKQPQLLRQGETSSVLVGTIVDLGGGITISVGQES